MEGTPKSFSTTSALETAGGRQLVTHLSVVKTAGRQQFIGLYSNLLGSKSREGREGQGLERDPVFRDLLGKGPASGRQTPRQIGWC